MKSEFSRVHCRNDVPDDGLDIELAATAEECAAIAGRLGLVALPDFRADAVLTHWRRDGLRLRGTLRATVVQTCVVSLEEFEQVIEETVEARFADSGDRILLQQADDAGEVTVEPEGEDPPEVLDGGCVDLGEYLVSSLAIALDPHPRKPGVELDPALREHGQGGEGAADKGENPFAALSALRKSETD